MKEKINLREQDWKEKLDEASYKVLREKDTERPFTGKYNDFFESGEYLCKACGNPLFKSDTKFDAGCGWPSFFDVLDKSAIELKEDFSHFMVRTEVLCAKCGSHLGHLFDDGPLPSSQRYCINSVCLDFKGE